VSTSSSWLNLVERWFRELSTQCIRRGAFFSVDDLQQTILEFLAVWNEDTKRLVWTATVDSIMESCHAASKPQRKFSPSLPCHTA